MANQADLQHLIHSDSVTINIQCLNNVPDTSFLFFLEDRSLVPLQGDFFFS